LDLAGCITQINKYEFAVIAARINPSGKLYSLADVIV
jgi:hypothetical protein